MELGDVSEAILTNPHIFLSRRCKFKRGKITAKESSEESVLDLDVIADTGSRSYLNNDNFIITMVKTTNIFEYFHVLGTSHTLVYLYSPNPLEVRFC